MAVFSEIDVKKIAPGTANMIIVRDLYEKVRQLSLTIINYY